MPQSTWNKATVPAGTDPWQLVPDEKKAIETTNSIVPVSSQAERDALNPPGGKFAGMTVCRLDQGHVLETYNGSSWVRGSVKAVVGGAGTAYPEVRAGEQATTLNGSGQAAVNLTTAPYSAFATDCDAFIVQATALYNGINPALLIPSMAATTNEFLWFTAIDSTNGSSLSGTGTLYVNFIAWGH